MKHRPPLHPNIYVGASSAEMQTASDYAEKLREAGARITYEWWENMRRVGRPDRELSASECSRHANANVFGIVQAWRVWLMFPKEGISKGLCAETGICIGLGKAFIVSGPWQGFLFAGMAEHIFETHDEALEHLIGLVNPVMIEDQEQQQEEQGEPMSMEELVRRATTG